MPVLNSTPKRLGIFFFFDSQGVVDRYVEVMLTDMMKNLSELIVVVNGNLGAKDYAKLRNFTDTVIIRDNAGLDVWAYKTALDRCGWDKLESFDEVVLFNATIMGPVYPFAEMFNEMATRDIDFWGITWAHEHPTDPFGTTPEGYIPRHLQSHFHVYRNSLVTSKEFQDYWNNMPPIRDYADSVGYHEAPFTQRFQRLGFVADAYVNTDDLEGYTYQPILFAPKKLMAEQRCPIFKRRSFFHNYDDVLDQSVGNATPDLYDFLRYETDFDTNLIWDNALRSMNLADIVKNLELTYVLPTKYSAPEKSPAKVALLMHLYYMDLLPESIHYMESMPEGSDIYITVGAAEKVDVIKKYVEHLPYNVEVRLIQNHGRDVAALLVGLRDVIDKYEYLCFMHDKKVTQIKPYSKGDGFGYKCFENILGSKHFVRNIIKQFDDNPRLGILSPTPPNHADYFPVYSFTWGPNFKRTKLLLQELGINVPLSDRKEPIAPLGSNFWFRSAALKPLFDYGWDWKDFPGEPLGPDGTISHAIERSHAYVAQSQGFYFAWLFSDSFARIELTNLSFYVQNLTRGISRHFRADTAVRMLRALESRHGIKRRAIETSRKMIPEVMHPVAKRAYHKLRKII